MDKRPGIKEQLVGTFVIAALVIFVLALIYFGRGQEWFKDYSTYFTSFDTTYNLDEGSPVKIMKNKVGKVKKLEIEESGKIRVEMKIDKDFTHLIRQDSEANVDNPTFVGIGTDFISITPGSKDKAPIPEDGFIEGREKTSVVEYWRQLDVDRDTQIQGAFELLKNTLMLSTTFRHQDSQLIELIKEAEKTMRKVSSEDGAAGTFIFNDQVGDDVAVAIHNLRVITDQIVEGKGLAGKMVMDEEYSEYIVKQIDDLLLISHEIQAILSQFAPTIDKFRQVADEFMGVGMDRVLTILDESEKVMKDMRQITAISREEADRITLLLNELHKLVRALNRSYLLRLGTNPNDDGIESLLRANIRGGE